MTDEQINVAEITDVTTLKAMAYDRLALIEQAQNEVRVLSARIGELSNAPLNGTKPAKV